MWRKNFMFLDNSLWFFYILVFCSLLHYSIVSLLFCFTFPCFVVHFFHHFYFFPFFDCSFCYFFFFFNPSCFIVPLLQCSYVSLNFFFVFPFVIALALGLRPKQKFTKVRAKNEARESHFMLLECRRVWGNEPTHYQVNSHFGNWSPNGLSNFQKTISKVKTHLIEGFFISLKSS
jgi:hypothetical protein